MWESNVQLNQQLGVCSILRRYRRKKAPEYLGDERPAKATYFRTKARRRSEGAKSLALALFCGRSPRSHFWEPKKKPRSSNWDAFFYKFT